MTLIHDNLTDEQIENIEENLPLTSDINEAIWLLGDERMVWGEFDMGVRGEDHRCIEVLYSNLNRYDNRLFWETVHIEYQAVRLVPETMEALIIEGQELTAIQKDLLNDAGYNVSEY